MLVFMTCCMALLFLIAPFPAQAVMPPHLTGSVPESAGVLTSDTILLEGYTLFRPGPGHLTMLDTTSGTPAPWEVLDLSCQGEGDPVQAETDDGAIQSYCTLSIRLMDPIPGHTYQLDFLDWTITFTYFPEE